MMNQNNDDVLDCPSFDLPFDGPEWTAFFDKKIEGRMRKAWAVLAPDYDDDLSRARKARERSERSENNDGR